MFRNHLIVALRQLRKQKFITSINLFGLLLGMTTALFIWQYVSYERSYDRFHQNADHIYRVRTDRIQNGEPFMQFAAGAAFSAKILNQFPEVEDYVKLKNDGEGVFTTPASQEGLRMKHIVYAMPSVFDVFDFPLVYGDRSTCLNEPFKACISESVAKRLFGAENPIGKTIARDNADDQRYEISGVFADFPGNSHIKLDIMLSYITFSDVLMADSEGATEDAPYWDGYYTYVQLRPGTDWKKLEAGIPEVIRREYEAEVAEEVELYLQPLTDIHLNSNYLFEAEVNGDAKAVYFLSIVGFIVLIIAWLNYINLAVARSVLRAKEIGVRKVAGGSRGSLISQFLTETALMNACALIISLLAFRFLHPFFEHLVGKAIPATLWEQPQFWLGLVGVFVLGTLLSGAYPALVMANYKPITALKTGLETTKGWQSSWLQRGLVVVQFAASVALIAATIIIFQQLTFMQNKDLGLNIDQTLIVKGPRIADSTFVDRNVTLKTEIEKIAGVRELAYSSAVPGQAYGWTAGGIQRMDNEVEIPEGFHIMATSLNYSELYELKLAAGRHMDTDRAGDKLSCLINETAAKLLRFETPEAAVGIDITFWGEQFKIMGVLEDFYQESPKSRVEPVIVRYHPGNWLPNYYSVKVEAAQLSSAIANMKGSWQELLPGNPFEYFFLDEHFAAQYAAEQRFGRLFSLFSSMAIIVSCLGLFALVAFMAERRRKEIGIRKVLGASVQGLVLLLSADFLKLTLAAILLATPIAWFLMDNWLANFAERMNIQWWVFALAGLIAIITALLTVSYRSLRAALANPVKALRSE